MKNRERGDVQSGNCRPQEPAHAANIHSTFYESWPLQELPVLLIQKWLLLPADESWSVPANDYRAVCVKGLSYLEILSKRWLNPILRWEN